MPINRTPFNDLVDDDGTNTVGSLWNKAAIKNVILDPVDVALGSTAVIQSTVLTGTQHNFPLVANCRILRCENTSLLTLSGFTAGYDGQVVTVTKSFSAGRVDFLHYNSGSATTNRFLNYATSGPTSFAGASQGTATYVYYTGRGWELRQHDQSTWIDVPYSASNFTASGSMTWTVDAGDVVAYRYLLKDKTLYLSFVLSTTSVGGTLSSALYLRLPSTYTAQAAQTHGLVRVVDNGVLGYAYALATATSPLVQFYTASGGNFAASTNATHVMGQLTLEVT